MSLKRYSRATVDKGEMTSQGFLRFPAFLTRTGVFKYRRADGKIIRELRHPDDVFAPDSISTLKMCPLTDDHPAEFITSENFSRFSKGYISDSVTPDSDKLSSSVIVADKSTIAKVDNGKVELSCGYYADLVDEQGTFDGEAYDVRQKNIRYNHVALVDRGRAGPQVRLRTDSEDSAEEITDSQKETPIMLKKIKINGQEIEVTQEVADAFEAQIAATAKAHNDALEAAKKLPEGALSKEDAAKITSECEALKAAKSELTAKVDHLEEKVKAHTDSASAEVIAKAVKARIAIEKVAGNVLGEEAKLDGKSDLDVMKEVIVKQSPKLDLADKDAKYIQARFDAIAEDTASREERRTQLAKPKNDSRKDEEFDSAAAKKKADAEAKDGWKLPLASQKK